MKGKTEIKIVTSIENKQIRKYLYFIISMVATVLIPEFFNEIAEIMQLNASE